MLTSRRQCCCFAATLENNGASAAGTFADGTSFAAANEGASIGVNVDGGGCDGQYYVSCQHCTDLRGLASSLVGKPDGIITESAMHAFIQQHAWMWHGADDSIVA